MFLANGMFLRIQVFQGVPSFLQARICAQQLEQRQVLHRLAVVSFIPSWNKRSSLHSPLPDRRGVELKFLNDLIAGAKATLGEARGRTAVLGIARRARANRKDMSMFV